MSVLPAKSKRKPVLMIEPGSMSARDIARVQRYGGILVVECSKPELSRFAEPPIDADLDAQARAAMALFRWIKDKQTIETVGVGPAIKFWVNALVTNQTPPPVATTKAVKR